MPGLGVWIDRRIKANETARVRQKVAELRATGDWEDEVLADYIEDTLREFSRSNQDDCPHLHVKDDGDLKTCLDCGYMRLYSGAWSTDITPASR